MFLITMIYVKTVFLLGIRRGQLNLVSRFHFHSFHEAITLKNRLNASGTVGENMAPKARVRGLKNSEC